MELVKANLFSIAIGLVKTVEYMHNFNFLHNDLHSQNILLHFVDDKAYVGIGDWPARSELLLVACPALADDKEATVLQAKRNYKHLALECFGVAPPKYSFPQEIYSLYFLLENS